MQIVSNGDNLLEMSNHAYGKKQKKTKKKKKKKKTRQFVFFWISPESGKG